jgi:anti-sigma factor RsiW
MDATLLTGVAAGLVAAGWLRVQLLLRRARKNQRHLERQRQGWRVGAERAAQGRLR